MMRAMLGSSRCVDWRLALQMLRIADVSAAQWAHTPVCSTSWWERGRSSTGNNGCSTSSSHCCHFSSLTAAMEQQLQQTLRRHNEISALLSGEVMGDGGMKQIQELTREYNMLQSQAKLFEQLQNARSELKEAEELSKDVDAEVRQWAATERNKLLDTVQKLEQQLLPYFSKESQDDHRNAILEVRAGTGGQEAALFALDLLNMYQKYAELHGWDFELVQMMRADSGGIKHATAVITGMGAYGRLKHENGVHRVQRVPVTESHGRLHTSTAAVVALPEANEVDIVLKESDLRIDTFRAGGAGGQHVNTTDSAVRVTHIPSGLVVSCQDERSQGQNKTKALKLLLAKLYDMELQKQEREASQERKQAVKTGDRNERIRTYNFQQGRITDHRTNFTANDMRQMLGGESLDGFIDAAITASSQADDV